MLGASGCCRRSPLNTIHTQPLLDWKAVPAPPPNRCFASAHRPSEMTENSQDGKQLVTAFGGNPSGVSLAIDVGGDSNATITVSSDVDAM